MTDFTIDHAAGMIRRQAADFRRRLLEIKRGSLDIEDVHQARVLSRRLRTAIWVFDGLFSKTRRRVWKNMISCLAKKLGQARDLDTRLDFVRNVLKTFSRRQSGQQIAGIVERLEKQRLKMQPDIYAATERFLKTGVLEDIENKLAVSLKGAAGVNARLKRRADGKIQRRLEDFIESGQGLKGRAWPRLHQLRIAVKRLRYTLEIFEPFYGREMGRYISEAIALQRNLGRLREFDVWAGDFSQESQGQGIEKDLGDICRSSREKEYKKFLKLRKKQAKQLIWQDLKHFNVQ
jgi:CHAD domain-containing protein